MNKLQQQTENLNIIIQNNYNEIFQNVNLNYLQNKIAIEAIDLYSYSADYPPAIYFGFHEINSLADKNNIKITSNLVTEVFHNIMNDFYSGKGIQNTGIDFSGTKDLFGLDIGIDYKINSNQKIINFHKIMEDVNQLEVKNKTLNLQSNNFIDLILMSPKIYDCIAPLPFLISDNKKILDCIITDNHIKNNTIYYLNSKNIKIQYPINRSEEYSHFPLGFKFEVIDSNGSNLKIKIKTRLQLQIKQNCINALRHDFNI